MTACVFVVTNRETGTLCACKLAERKPQRHTWSRLCQLLQHESQLLQEIGYHPSIVRWEGCYVSCNRVAIVTELVGGGDCQQLLQRHGALAEEAVQAMMVQLHAALRCVAHARAVHSHPQSDFMNPVGHSLSFVFMFVFVRSRLHGMGVLHRDVKLENLLCDTSTRPPRVKLCDFGHAVSARDLGGDRHFYGTPGYAAPEVMNGPVWTAKADVWAMGVVMYALLANSLPFEYDDGWRRPPDLSSRVWWRVSLEAKLLLQALLEPQLEARASLSTFEQSAWYSLALEGRIHDQPAMRHAFSFTDMGASPIRQPDALAERRRVASGRAAGSLPHAASWTELQLDVPAVAADGTTGTCGAGHAAGVHAVHGSGGEPAAEPTAIGGSVNTAAVGSAGACACGSDDMESSSDAPRTLSHSPSNESLTELLMPEAEETTPSPSPRLDESAMAPGPPPVASSASSAASPTVSRASHLFPPTTPDLPSASKTLYGGHLPLVGAVPTQDQMMRDDAMLALAMDYEAPIMTDVTDG